jgi:hypothetical protein
MEDVVPAPAAAADPDSSWPCVRLDPATHYEFSATPVGRQTVVLAAGVALEQTLFAVRPRADIGAAAAAAASSPSPASLPPFSDIDDVEGAAAAAAASYQPLPLFAKVYTLPHKAAVTALLQHVRVWRGIDESDRPGSGKLKAVYLHTVEVAASSSPPSSSDGGGGGGGGGLPLLLRRRPQITLIQEGSPEAPMELRRHYERYYTHFGQPIGRGGNAGGIPGAVRPGPGGHIPALPFGGVYLGAAVDFVRPLPFLAVKRVDGRDLAGADRRRDVTINTPRGQQKLLKEVTTWASVHFPSPHPRVVRILDAFLDPVGDDAGNVVASVVMEAAPRAAAAALETAAAAASGAAPPRREPTDLVDYVCSTGRPLSHWSCVHVLAQVFMALNAMHTRVPQIVHRDIKGDNIVVWDRLSVPLFTADPVTGAEVPLLGGEPQDLYIVKLADFGEARFLKPDDAESYTNVGTDAYKAPEVGRAPQTPGVDVFSCGVTLFTLLLANAPFGISYSPATGLTKAQWLEKLRRGAGALNESSVWPSFCSDVDAHAQDAIKRMMEADPTRRATIPELFAHPLFARARAVFYKVGGSRVPIVPAWREK